MIEPYLDLTTTKLVRRILRILSNCFSNFAKKITTCICSTQNLSAGAKWVAEGSNDGTLGGSTTTIMGAK